MSSWRASDGKCNAQPLIRAALTVEFQASRLFVIAHADDLRSFTEGEEVLAGGMSLSFGGDEAWLCAGDRRLRRLSFRDGDDFGQWPDGADRSSQDDRLAAMVSLPDFLDALADDGDLRLTWWSITESEVEEDGRHRRVVRSAVSASPDSGRPESDRRW